MAKYDMSLYEGLENEKIWKQYGEEICDLKDTEKWDIPQIIVVKAAVTGAFMGLHIRVGMEDTIFVWPHSNEVIDSNARIVRSMITIAKEMGRRVATSDEYREILGLKRKRGSGGIARQEDVTQDLKGFLNGAEKR